MHSSLSFLGKTFIILGAAFLVLGGFILLAERLPPFGLGRLPGDIVVKRDNFTFYLPLGTCILISLALTGFLWLLSLFLKR